MMMMIIMIIITMIRGINNNSVTGSFRHYSVPYVPEIEGIEKFKGQIQHSKAYRSAEAYRNLRVVVLGAASSGVDIAMEVAAVADEVRSYVPTPAARTLTSSHGCQRYLQSPCVYVLKICVL
jgi:thioredoxin reductase